MGDNGSNDDIDMGNVIFSISADQKLKPRADLWENKDTKKQTKHWNDDIKKTSEAVAKEGLNTALQKLVHRNEVLG